MSFLTTDDVLNLRIDMIESKFSTLQLEFSKRVYEDHLELWVYVMNFDKYDEVKKFCDEEVEQLQVEPQIPIWIITQTWTGPWPGGESEQEITKRRQTFKERLERRLGRV